jgi:hypothetical protein
MGPKPKAPEKGICFPKDKKGGRSTSDAGKAIIAASLRGCGTADGDKYAEACEKERNWRFKYNKHFKNLVKVCTECAPGPVFTSFYHHIFMFIH